MTIGVFVAVNNDRDPCWKRLVGVGHQQEVLRFHLGDNHRLAIRGRGIEELIESAVQHSDLGEEHNETVLDKSNDAGRTKRSDVSVVLHPLGPRYRSLVSAEELHKSSATPCQQLMAVVVI